MGGGEAGDSAPEPDGPGAKPSDVAALEVMERLLEDLDDVNRQKGSTLVLVHIPIREELVGDPYAATYARWRDYLTALAGRRGVIYFDVAQALDSIPVAARRDLYFDADVGGFWGGEGHLTPQGNLVVGRLIYDRIVAEPQVAERLAALAPASPLLE